MLFCFEFFLCCIFKLTQFSDKSSDRSIDYYYTVYILYHIYCMLYCKMFMRATTSQKDIFCGYTFQMTLFFFKKKRKPE